MPPIVYDRRRLLKNASLTATGFAVSRFVHAQAGPVTGGTRIDIDADMHSFYHLQSTASSPVNTQTSLEVERLDGGLDRIVPKGSTLLKAATGFTWIEGPIWISEGYLLFAEITSNSIRKLDQDGKVSILLQPSGYKGSAPFAGPEPGTNGMTLDARGRLTVAGHGQRDVFRLESLNRTAQQTILADTYNGKRLNSPNDVVYRSDGSLYFTDPPYGLQTQRDSDPLKELSVNGVYRIPNALTQKPGTEPQRDQLQQLITALPRPNGIVFSPDEKYLYVNNTGPKKIWMRYGVKKDGTLSDGEIFFDASSDQRRGAPDGMKVDHKGNIYSAGPAGIWIFSPAGVHLGTLLIPEQVGNLNWGGADHKTLYITASRSIYTVALTIPGIVPKTQ